MMTQSVDRPKELLFEREAETLAALARRVEALNLETRDRHDELIQLIEDLETRDHAAREAIEQRLASLIARTGDDEVLTRSVADVLDRAFSEAERHRHDQLANAVSPVIVRTVRTEITNSRDEIAEALYPVTGQMVKAYVASAMRDLVNQINHRLENNALMLRIKSLTTGRSMAELAIADGQRLHVEELMLIRRGSGELVARWPERPTGNYDHVFGGVLTAIHSFATEALDSDEANLRQIDLGSSQVYLRTSPTYLLAARCSGIASSSVETIIDEEFLKAVSRISSAEAAEAVEADGAIAKTLDEAADNLGQRITRRHAELSTPAFGMSPVRLLAWLIGVPLALWLAWTTYVTIETRRVEAIAADIIRTSPEIKGYPNTIDIAPRGRSMRVTGLAPSDDAAGAVIGRLAAALPDTQIDNQIAIVPNAGADAAPEVRALRKELSEVRANLPRQLAERDLERAKAGLVASATEIGRLAAVVTATRTRPAVAAATGAEALGAISAASKTIDETLKSLGTIRAELKEASPSPARGREIRALLDRRTADLAAVIQRLTNDVGAGAAAAANAASKNAGGKPAAEATATQSPTYEGAAERLATQSERLSALSIALVQAALARAAIPPPAAPVVVRQESTALEQLTDFMRTNAIFFGNDTEYRDTVVADATLDRLVELARQTSALIRIVGYTDERGTNARNSTVSQGRAQKVRDALVERGLSADRIIAIGRNSARDISTAIGPSSPNRRVEFEMGFQGEVTR
ncbi:MAG: OmpA family protein [Hyphomicrobiaceae bacterium]|nr:OmpA family protein [Hyphomicrobiaceae bacterium]